jgi:hypothetical protein
MTRKKVEQAAHDNFSRIVSLARGQSGSRNSGSKHGRVPDQPVQQARPLCPAPLHLILELARAVVQIRGGVTFDWVRQGKTLRYKPIITWLPSLRAISAAA